MTSLRTTGCALVLVAVAGSVGAQEKSADQSGQPTIPLRVQVVIAQYKDDRKLSSLPYVLSTSAGGNATLRMGTMVPVKATSYTPIAQGGAGVNPLTSYNYRDVGTNIDCSTAAVGENRYRLALTIEDSSVYPEDQAPRNTGEMPSFRSFRASDSVVLKDGETKQFTTAVDKVTGIVTKVDVTLNVVK